MSRVHRTLDGDWAECEDVTCELVFHFPGMSVDQLAGIPQHILLPMLNLIQQSTHMTASGFQFWRDTRFPYPKTVLHREYDLPALITPDGTMKWYYAGKLHRVGGPAVVYPNGRWGEWWAMGERLPSLDPRFRGANTNPSQR